MLIPMSLGQQTAAVRALFMKNGARKATGTRKRTPKRPTRTKARAVTKKRGAMRLVKGSAAAKRYMARIRKMRKR